MAILGDRQAQERYGTDLASMGIQAIWLRIEKRSALARWLLVSALDQNCLTPAEAASLFGAGMPNETAQRTERHCSSNDLDLDIGLESGLPRCVRFCRADA